jgi:hypothetical protein
MDIQKGDICVFADTSFKVLWNGGTTFNVFDSFGTEVDCFSVNGVTNSSDAIWHANNFIENLYKEMGGADV